MNDSHAWAADLEPLLAQVWLRLVRGVGDRHAAARHPTLATVSAAGWPEARTVVLRACDPLAGTLDIHTDLRSAKVAALRVNSRAGLHVWDAGAQLQTRAEVVAEVLTGEAVSAIWARVPDPSRQSYGTEPAPGVPIEAPLDYAKRADAGCFAVLRLTVQAFDVLHLGPQHRRARFQRADAWAGRWLAP